jgi:hypothetical protein
MLKRRTFLTALLAPFASTLPVAAVPHGESFASITVQEHCEKFRPYLGDEFIEKTLARYDRDMTMAEFLKPMSTWTERQRQNFRNASRATTNNLTKELSNGRVRQSYIFQP